MARREPIAWHCVSIVNRGDVQITRDAGLVEARRQQTFNDGKAWEITPLYLNKVKWMPIVLFLAGVFWLVCSQGTDSHVKGLLFSVLANAYFLGSFICWEF